MSDERANSASRLSSQLSSKLRADLYAHDEDTQHPLSSVEHEHHEEDAAGEKSDGGGGLLGLLVSIKGCTIMLCILCIAGTAAICVVLAVASADRALDEKDQQYAKALDAVTSTSQDSIESLTHVFVNTLVESERIQVLDYTRVFTRLSGMLVDDMKTWPARGLRDDVWDDWYPALAARFWASVPHYFSAGLTGLGSINSKEGWTIWTYEHGRTLGNAPDGEHELFSTVSLGGNNNTWHGMVIPGDGRLDYSRPCCYVDGKDCGKADNPPANYTGFDYACYGIEQYNYRTLSLYQLTMLLPIFPPGQVRWSPLSISGSHVGVAAIGTWTDNTAPSTKRGVYIVGADLRSIKGVYEKAVRTTPGAEMRIFSMVRHEFVYHAMGPQLASILDFKNQHRLLTGVSHGSSEYEYRHWDAAANCFGCLRRWVRIDTNASDYLIRQVAIEVNGTYDDYNATREITVSAAPGVAPEGFFVKSTVIEDSYGLNWWLVVVVDRAYVLEKVEKEVAQTQEDVRVGKQNIDDDIKQDRLILYIAVAGAAAAFIMLSVVFVSRVNAPLGRLLVEMQHVSEMDVDSVDENRSLSGLQEVQSMEVSFRKMIHNLREFRKYMPASILDDDGEEHDTGAVSKGPPPPEGTVTLVFTDIKGSTSLWEQATEAMGISLKLHNKIMREAIAECNGYEVKTVGDAFFVVFQDAADACRFGVKAQYDLNYATWPQDLADCGLIQSSRIEEAGKLLYAGVRVRIGVHTGPCELELNPMTGRADYFGPPVNVAARLEANGAAGFVGISDEVRSAVGENALKDICGAMVPLGVKELKGVGKPVNLLGLLPKGLEGRAKFVDADGAELFKQYAQPADPAKEVPVAAAAKKKQVVPERLRSALTAARGATASLAAPLDFDESSGLAPVLDCANTQLAAAELAAERTEGLLQQAAGSLILITWNAGRRCANARDQALEWCCVLYKRMHKERLRPTLGIAVGVVLHGNLGRGARRFATVLGGCVELSSSMACFGRRFGAFALCSGVELTGRTRPAMRPVERWLVPGWQDAVTVCQLDCERLAGLQDQGEERLRPFVDRAYREAFELNSQDKFVEWSEADPTDRVLAHLAQNPTPSAPQEAWWICGAELSDDALARRGSSVGSHISVQTTGGRRRRASGARKAQPDEKKGDAYQQQQAG
eukprot:TRINITY_DN137_c0_g4_i1.p1 TRINITY_DN137_c0_g4~~TRINITY_DN137_c0_g4_i1.p1  ORF type:complete len:1170 (+),score=345.05 TRINITY_DN137_c0_g4_i1:116-3625(+)